MASQPSAPPAPLPAEERDAPPEYDRVRAWLITAMIVVFMVVNFADKAVLGLAAVPIMDELNISHGTYGLVSSSFSLLFSLSGLLVGFLSSRVTSRVLLLVMTLTWALAQLPVLVVASVPTLIAGRVLLGAAEGPAASMSMHALYKWFPPHRRGLPSALQISGAALGTLVSAPVLTWLITEHGWRSAYVALAVVSTAWALVWWRIGYDGPFDDDRAARAEARRGSGRPAARLPYRRLLLNGTVLGSIASAFGASWALSLSHAWVPSYLRTELGMTPGAAASTISAVAGFSLVLLLTVSPLMDLLKSRGVSSRWSSGATQGFVVCAAGCAMAAFPFVEGTVPRLLLIGLAFGTGAVAVPLHYMTVAEVVPTAQRGAVFGIVAATGTLPGLVGPTLTGHLIDAAGTTADGYRLSFLITALVMLLTGLLAVACIRPERDAARLATVPNGTLPQGG
ncbi:MFS transporter [Streptomyces sp. HNM0574]|uniref:MFS transporter n=1 Tax=Streptomyces sp. HNM0574 TaxID=2714954 RepID=UPI00146A09A7|nr:MFS transporter [Streptomyces sp. HNM0574]NLU68279.1 MFS transporter [Streptomyces sp. HNM0574]